jgi:hypothetical protein
MPIAPPPTPPVVEASSKQSGAPIADMRDAFARKTPQTDEDRARARAFVEGKIEMIRRDPRMSAAEKEAAIADLRSRR